MDVQICALNSCRITATRWTEYGYVNKGGTGELEKLPKIPVKRPTYRLAALHHHLVPVDRVETPTGDGVSLTLNAVEVLDAAQVAGVHIVVHGHQHVPRVTEYRSLALQGETVGQALTIVSGGSAGVVGERIPGSHRNTYSLFEFNSDAIRLVIRELRPDGKSGGTLFDRNLSCTPQLPSERLRRSLSKVKVRVRGGSARSKT